MKIYMAVTNDKYELPIMVCNTYQDLARRIGVNKNSLLSEISKGNRNVKNNCKFVKVIVEEDEHEN